MADAFVRWSQSNENGVFARGYMRKSGVQECIQRFETQASEVLKNTGADHVIYAVKHYGEQNSDGTSDLQEVRFYMVPLSDEEFHKRTSLIDNAVVYAVHKR